MLKRFTATVSRLVCVWSALALGALFSLPALADDKHLCVPNADGVPGLAGPPAWLGGSAISSSIDDPRWRGATGQSYGDGNTPHSRLRLLQSGGKLYLSFQVFAGAQGSQLPDDAVYIALSQANNTTHHLLRLQVVATTNVKASVAGVSVSHFTWSGSAWTGAAPPIWLEDAAAWVTVDPTDGDPEWAINLKVDYSTLGLTPPFKFWSGSSVQLTTAPTKTYAVSVWPLGSLGPWSSGNGQAIDQDIQDNDWGELSIGTSGCSTGVSLKPNDIGVKSGSALSGNLSPTQSHTFAAWPSYNGVSTAVGKVQARFRLAPEAAVADWESVGPAFTAVPSAAGGKIEEDCVNGGNPACPVLPGAIDRQCLLVELSSPANVTFLSDSAYRCAEATGGAGAGGEGAGGGGGTGGAGGAGGGAVGPGAQGGGAGFGGDGDSGGGGGDSVVPGTMGGADGSGGETSSTPSDPDGGASIDEGTGGKRLTPSGEVGGSHQGGSDEKTDQGCSCDVAGSTRSTGVLPLALLACGLTYARRRQRKASGLA